MAHFTMAVRNVEKNCAGFSPQTEAALPINPTTRWANRPSKKAAQLWQSGAALVDVVSISCAV
ncbi:hypothetical protein IMCC20628_01012 [Hoeflea sp. IMCC20628]|uniref:hypothetical protein n=1 Tax=Hoeflea sp. IMCC20628 TaxID=1620421 RepID=UPI00063AEA7B|nr:hypothetical protein [Hoeflea sp. IMCC20628]AKH99729.1 hypothetical protein IMCC20628_01012 [Hoeflea sp. IMCC20628]